MAKHHDGMATARGVEHLPTQGHIARGGAPKRHADVAVHPGMVTRSTKTGAYHAGADSLSRADADPASPLQAPPAGKKLTAPVPHPNMRSRVNDPPCGGPADASSKPDPAALRSLGQKILSEAKHSPDDAWALPHYLGGAK